MKPEKMTQPKKKKKHSKRDKAESESCSQWQMSQPSQRVFTDNDDEDFQSRPTQKINKNPYNSPDGHRHSSSDLLTQKAEKRATVAAGKPKENKMKNDAPVDSADEFQKVKKKRRLSLSLASFRKPEKPVVAVPDAEKTGSSPVGKDKSSSAAGKMPPPWDFFSTGVKKSKVDGKDSDSKASKRKRSSSQGKVLESSARVSATQAIKKHLDDKADDGNTSADSSRKISKKMKKTHHASQRTEKVAKDGKAADTRTKASDVMELPKKIKRTRIATQRELAEKVDEDSEANHTGGHANDVTKSQKKIKKVRDATPTTENVDRCSKVDNTLKGKANDVMKSPKIMKKVRYATQRECTENVDEDSKVDDTKGVADDLLKSPKKIKKVRDTTPTSKNIDKDRRADDTRGKANHHATQREFTEKVEDSKVDDTETKANDVIKSPKKIKTVHYATQREFTEEVDKDSEVNDARKETNDIELPKKIKKVHDATQRQLTEKIDSDSKVDDTRKKANNVIESPKTPKISATQNLKRVDPDNKSNISAALDDAKKPKLTEKNNNAPCSEKPNKVKIASPAVPNKSCIIPESSDYSDSDMFSTQQDIKKVKASNSKENGSKLPVKSEKSNPHSNQVSKPVTATCQTNTISPKDNSKNTSLKSETPTASSSKALVRAHAASQTISSDLDSSESESDVKLYYSGCLTISREPLGFVRKPKSPKASKQQEQEKEPVESVKGELPSDVEHISDSDQEYKIQRRDKIKKLLKDAATANKAMSEETTEKTEIVGGKEIVRRYEMRGNKMFEVVEKPYISPGRRKYICQDGQYFPIPRDRKKKVTPNPNMVPLEITAVKSRLVKD